MDTRELLQYELDKVGKQIDRCLDGLTEAGYDTKCAVKGMTPREMLVHLAEVYEAFMASMRGETYEWGSYKLEDTSTQNVRRVFSKGRSKAVEIALASLEDKVIKGTYDYLVGHDNYHVGQLVLSRMQVDAEWDPEAIYG